MISYIKNKPTLSFLFFSAAANILVFLIFLMYAPLRAANGDIGITVLYYLTQILSSAITFFSVFCIITALRRRGIKYSAFLVFISCMCKLVINVATSLIDTVTYSLYDTVVLLLQSFLILLQDVLLYAVFIAIDYLCSKRKACEKEAYFFSTKNAKSASALFISLITLFFKTVMEVADIISFFADSFGIYYFSDIISMILSYLFVVFTIAVGYVILIYADRIAEKRFFSTTE